MEPFHSHRGFSLIELLVVLAIIMTISGVVFTSQSTFNKTIILANTAYDIALTLRNAETYGLGSRGAGAITSGCIANAGYGIHVTSGNSYVLFADTSPASVCATPDQKPGDHAYTAGADLTVQTYTLGNGIYISNFCAGSSCASGGLPSLDIIFERPNPTPFVNGSTGSACLALVSPQAPLSPRFISIGASGVINANALSCP